MDTIGDCLKVMEGDVLADDGGGLGQLTIAELEDARWKALALFLGELAESQGVELDRAILSEAKEPQKPDGKKRGISWWGGYKE